MLNGNSPGRIKLRGDDGEARNPIGGASVSSGNYALDVKAASGFHGQFTHSTSNPIILAIADSGNVTASAINSGDVGIARQPDHRRRRPTHQGRLLEQDHRQPRDVRDIDGDSLDADADAAQQRQGSRPLEHLQHERAGRAAAPVNAITATHGILAVESTAAARCR